VKQINSKKVIILLLLGFLWAHPSMINLTELIQENSSLSEVFSVPNIAADISQALRIDLIDTENNSIISDRSELLFQLTGSSDQLVFYRWNTEDINETLLVIDEFFVLLPPFLISFEGTLGLDLYASENSSQTDSFWVHYYFQFFYDSRVPQFSLSLALRNIICFKETKIISHGNNEI
jgi:hypothetical protein